MSEYIIRVNENDERWHYVEQQYTHFFGYPITEEIVRCRDCAKWSFFDVEDGVRYGECAEFTAKVDSGCGHATRESGFCAWGERW